MLEKVFSAVLSMALSASYVILIVLLGRLALKKAPKVLSYALWAVVLFRLLCPVSFESPWSLQRVKPNAVTPGIVYAAQPQIDSGIPAFDGAVNAALPAPAPETSVNPMQLWMFLGEIIWLCGIAAMLVYSLVTLFRLRRRLVGAVRETGNVWLCDGVETPFVLGVFRPKIYLPSKLSEREKDYILIHERTHLRRGDNVVKLVLFLTLCAYWFDPLVWLAFFLCGRDMEMSCDEAVMKTLGAETRCDYSSSLLRLSAGKRIVAGAPLAFCEGEVMGRIQNVLNYKKPAFWAVWLSVAAVAALCFCLAANPEKEETGGRNVLFQELGDGNAFALELPESCTFRSNGSYTEGVGGSVKVYASGFSDGKNDEESDLLFIVYLLHANAYRDRLSQSPTLGYAGGVFRELGSCDNMIVYAALSDGSRVGEAHRTRYDKMLADLRMSLNNASFSSTDSRGTLYADRENGFYLRLPASWKGAYFTDGPYDGGETRFCQSDCGDLSYGRLFSLCVTDSGEFQKAYGPTKHHATEPLVLADSNGETYYLLFNEANYGTNLTPDTEQQHKRLLAAAKKIKCEDLYLSGISPLKADVSFTARTPTQEEFDENIGTSGIKEPKPEDFLYLMLSVKLSGKQKVDGTSVDFPDLLNTIRPSLQTDVLRYWTGSREVQDNADEDTAVYRCDICLYRRYATDAVVRKAFAGQSVTVRYRVKGSTVEEIKTYPLDQSLTFGNQKP